MYAANVFADYPASADVMAELLKCGLERFNQQEYCEFFPAPFSRQKASVAEKVRQVPKQILESIGTENCLTFVLYLLQ